MSAADLPRRLLTFAVVLGLALCVCGWRSEADAYTSVLDQWLDVAFSDGECAQIAGSLDAWKTAQSPAIEQSTDAFVARIDALDSLDEVVAVDEFIEDYWDTAFERGGPILGCLDSEPTLAPLLTDFEAMTSERVSAAVADARARIEAAQAAAPPSGANMELARVAADTFARTVTRYKDAVEYHGARGCEDLANAHGFWMANYYEIFDSSSSTLSAEIQRMNAAEYTSIEPLLASVETDRAALARVETCADSLDGDTATRLDAQRASLAWIIQLVRVSRPLDP